MFVFLNITNIYKLQFKEINQLEKKWQQNIYWYRIVF